MTWAAAPHRGSRRAPSSRGRPIHDFDFYMGTWRVHHRRLKERLVGSDEWQEFEGTSTAWPILDGAGNIDDNVLELPAGTYRAVSLRTYDPATDRWSIWWLDGRNPSPLDPPVVGGFEDGIGTFIAEDTFDGQPILVRFLLVGHHRPRPAAGSRPSRPTAARPGRSTGSWSPSESTSVRAPRSRPGRSRPRRSRPAPASSPAPRTPARVSVRTSSRPRHCCSRSTPGPRRRPGRARPRMRSAASAAACQPCAYGRTTRAARLGYGASAGPRTMQRKPRWAIEVSIDCGWLAAGR